MTKRKNPLKDLDSFLKQEASTLVEPEKIKVSKSAPPAYDKQVISKEDVLSYFEELAIKDQEQFKTTFLDIMHKSLEFHGLNQATDKMLMNTLLYLQNQDNWKEAIAAYWSTK